MHVFTSTTKVNLKPVSNFARCIKYLFSNKRELKAIYQVSDVMDKSQLKDMILESCDDVICLRYDYFDEEWQESGWRKLTLNKDGSCRYQKEDGQCLMNLNSRYCIEIQDGKWKMDTDKISIIGTQKASQYYDNDDNDDKSNYEWIDNNTKSNARHEIKFDDLKFWEVESNANIMTVL